MNLLQCTLLLTSNFNEDPLFQYSFRGTEAQRQRGMEAYFNAALDLCLAEGEIILAPGNAGVLAWIPGQAFPPQVDAFKMTGQPAYVLEAWDRFHLHEQTPEHLIQARARNFAYIWLLAVDFSVRGRGYGKWLLDSCAEQAREAGLEAIWLSTENEKSLGFYEKSGFQQAVSAVSAAGLTTYILTKPLL
ncbi:GNAT family N-acetyltransferase [Flavihumibacter sp. CACIAM 22H1]|uniref:GNAT family N-acetyltransferase n=1 Tax=Flavihumibacter sp. CACIAM 22H1 TaxID=1812911 RepID=UPI0007A8E0A1|nr:GNAT family N-acetyltransferase [Flavihumibacter sp. CACIAM 22H1]KYP13725.1 MAG: hypothetical protein A1D16_04450 [Flavihumibacter sp. CACIAM 22H1]